MYSPVLFPLCIPGLAVTAHTIASELAGRLCAIFNVARRIRTVIAVVIMSHMRGRDNHVRFFIHIKFLNHHLLLQQVYETQYR